MAAVLRSCACANGRVSQRPLAISSKIAASSVLTTVPAAMANEMNSAVPSGDFVRAAGAFWGWDIAAILLKPYERFQQRRISKMLTLMVSICTYARCKRLPQRQTPA